MDGENEIDGIEGEGILMGSGEVRGGNSRKRQRRISAVAKATIGARKLMGFDGTIGRNGKEIGRKLKDITFF